MYDHYNLSDDIGKCTQEVIDMIKYETELGQ